MRGSTSGLREVTTTSSPQNGNGNNGGSYEWSGVSTPGSVSSGHFNDERTVDSWNTTMTSVLQPHKSQKNTFQCATHLGFITKDPLDICPHCERQQQLTLQERRKSVEQQLREMDMPSSSGSSVTKDILSDLQSTVKQWKQQPAPLQQQQQKQQQQPPQQQQQQQQQMAPPSTSDGNASTSTANADNTRHPQSNNLNNNQNQNQNQNNQYRSINNNNNQSSQSQTLNQNPYQYNGGMHSSYSNGSSNSQQPPQQQLHSQQQPPQQQLHSQHPQNSYSGGMGGMLPPMAPQMQQMMPPPPPMVASFNGASYGGNPGPPQQQQSPLEALALQIQGMQRMQDWMLYQKEQECQTLRQRLDSATQQINTLAVDNALLQEKLHQQEQRMKHELKLIKLAAMQQRNSSSARDANKSSSSSQHSGSIGPDLNTSNALVPMSNAGAPRSSNNSVNSANSQGPTGSMTNDSFGLFPSSDAMAQPKTSVVTSALTRQDHDNFFNRYQSPHHASITSGGNQQPRNSNDGFSNQQQQQQQQQQAMQPYGSYQQQQSTKMINPNDGNPQKRDPLKLMNSLSLSPESKEEEEEPPLNQQRRDSAGPVDLDDVQKMGANKNRQANVLSSPQRSIPTTTNSSKDNNDFSYGTNQNNSNNVPRDIQITPSVSSESTGEGGTRTTPSKPIPALKPPPEKGGVTNKSLIKPQQQQPAVQAEPTGPPPPILVNVNFPDSSDNHSIGNTVASSTYGEDRQQVNSQVILDPYGDRGTYTGVILRSTGMPHGSGRMIYQEDNRTYDGEWRHGRWHGYGRATFANGDNYHGEYRFDQRHGRGRYEWNDGRVYDGMFREDKRHGRGIFTWPDGAVYEGDFRNGQREGHGTYRFSDGGRYEGSWKDGRYNGFGICNWEDGRCYKGEWMNGMAHGKGVETFADGTVRHDGQWVEDEPVMAYGNHKQP